ncbi:metalloregulator ArsR/SmtB family transcription factor [Pseudidiomarina sp.]|uniref:ArsR/SmtB family transcription factor n=1 Tax=Pseudidiomarina sp. TaxID=2081707 RepID=UPI00299EABA8|nr:metalloregulator ArsR/SmtB family transcription factor [Pseudidiomarina sp.]MDX1706232.1 metalloregulator ArsR/SmtB family transcription factor [Pseudidiomarina sp.]
MDTLPLGQMQQDEAKFAARFLRSLANEHRLQILCYLTSGEKSVSQLNQFFPHSASAFSQHLAVLRQQGLLIFRKEGQTIYYSIADPDMRKFLELIKDKFCADHHNYLTSA